MLLCIDIGNTNIVIGVTKEGRILHCWRLRTEKDITDDELGILIANLFSHSNVQNDDIRHIIISCVVPPLLKTMDDRGTGLENRHAHPLR
jgi:type III pantothenate kinase